MTGGKAQGLLLQRSSHLIIIFLCQHVLAHYRVQCVDDDNNNNQQHLIVCQGCQE